MIFKYKCYQYNKYIAMRLFFSDKSIVLFELFDRWWKEKQANQGTTSLSRARKQHKKKISITFAITNNLRPWDFLRPASNIALRPTPDTKSYRTSLQTHLTPPPSPSKEWWDSFERPHNWRISSPASSPVTAIGNRTCSNHCPQSSLSLHTWGDCPTTLLNNHSTKRQESTN